MDTPLLALGPDQKGDHLLVGADRLIHYGREVPEEFASVAQLDCTDAGIGLSFVNAHTHLYSGLAPLGMPVPDPQPRDFVKLLEEIWWKLDRALDENSLRAAARYYVAHALLDGTTGVFDHLESPAFIEGSLDVLADACQELGMRAVLCYGVTERNGGRDEAKRGLAECRRFIESNRRPLVRGAVGLHASFTASDETIREAGELARELDTVIHVHVAEASADVEDAMTRGYPGPLERLLALGALVPQSILAHGVHLGDAQVRLAAEAECWIVQNPRSNRGNKVGYPAHLADCERAALGTDGYPSKGEDEVAALFEEARMHDLVTDGLWLRQQKGHAMMAERWGYARSMLTAGALPDAVVLTPTGVRHLVVAGQGVVADGKLTTAEIGEIDAEAERAATSLWERMRAL